MKNKKTYKFEYSFKTDTGKVRLTNQDNVKIIKNKFDDILMIVADGMGGHSKGDYASKLALDYIEEKFLNFKSKLKSRLLARAWIRYVVYTCNKYIYDMSIQSNTYKGMGTTVVLMLIFNNNIINLNVGDSRSYLITNDKITLFSEDQSYVKYLEHVGKITKEEAETSPDANQLTTSLGLQPSTSQIVKGSKYNGETILLCSDGLFRVLKDDEILSIVKQEKDINVICDELIDAANKYGGPDNISVALLRSVK